VAYTTDDDLYLLNADLSLRAEYSTTSFQDFGTATAALSDDLVFAILADGTQKVLRTSDASEVSATEFTESSGNAASTLAKGQPALAGGHVIFASDRGAFAYTTRDGTPPRVGNLRPASVIGGGTLEADAVDARGIRDVQFLIDGAPVGTATNPVRGQSHTPGGGHFIAGWDAAGTAPGPHTLEAIATDNGGQTSVAKAILMVQPHTPFADTEPPETAIMSGPSRRTADTTPRFRYFLERAPRGLRMLARRRALPLMSRTACDGARRGSPPASGPRGRRSRERRPDPVPSRRSPCWPPARSRSRRFGRSRSVEARWPCR
jgi:hypothetical protein